MTQEFRAFGVPRSWIIMNMFVLSHPGRVSRGYTHGYVPAASEPFGRHSAIRASASLVRCALAGPCPSTAGHRRDDFVIFLCPRGSLDATLFNSSGWALDDSRNNFEFATLLLPKLYMY